MKQRTVDFRRFLLQMYRDFFKWTLLVWLLACAVTVCTSFRGLWFLYLFEFLGVFGVSFVLCFTRKDKPSEFVEGDK